MRDTLKSMLPQPLKNELKRLRAVLYQQASRLEPANAALPPPPLAQFREISTIEELDAEIERCDRMAEISSDAFNKAVSEFCYVIKEKLPADPTSPAYLEFQRDLYLKISGRERYRSDENERSPFDFELAKNHPYPYQTKSATVVGDQLIAQGYLIKMMNLPPGARILEFGVGWGNTTLHLLQMGYQITAVDVEPDFLRLVQHRAGELSSQIELVNQDMLEFRSETKYDAALFFECFHHCSDHIQLLKNLDQQLKQTGIMVFAAEPIASFPYPWGLRLDGISVYSIRKYGWLELGFDTAYFMQLLHNLGWSVERHRSDLTHLADVIIARRKVATSKPST